MKDKLNSIRLNERDNCLASLVVKKIEEARKMKDKIKMKYIEDKGKFFSPIYLLKNAKNQSYF